MFCCVDGLAQRIPCGGARNRRNVDGDRVRYPGVGRHSGGGCLPGSCGMVHLTLGSMLCEVTPGVQ